MESNILNKAYDFILYMLPKIEKIPRSHKFLIGDRIESGLLDVMDHLIRAFYAQHDTKVLQLKEVNIRLEQLRILIRLSHDQKFINHRIYGIISEKLNEIGKMCGGWLKALT